MVRVLFMKGFMVSADTLGQRVLDLFARMQRTEHGDG